MWYRFAIGTAAVVAFGAAIGLFNTFQWILSLPGSLEDVALPNGVLWSALTLIAYLLASLAVISAGRTRFAAFNAGMTAMLLIHLISWGQRYFTTELSRLSPAAHSVRLLLALWLLLLIYENMRWWPVRKGFAKYQHEVRRVP